MSDPIQGVCIGISVAIALAAAVLLGGYLYDRHVGKYKE